MNRFAGSKDGAAISENVYAVLRLRSSLAWRMGRDNLRAMTIASLLVDSRPVEPLLQRIECAGVGPARPTRLLLSL
jgi:hypothetical protein